jgi:adenosine deaminase/adenosine deaminase CECR1
MRYFIRFILCFAALSFIGCASINTNVTKDNFFLTATLYDYILHDHLPGNNEPDMALLNLFFAKMPKGGDIHHHYSGTIYAETYLDWVGKKGWLIDPCSLTIINPLKSHKNTLCDKKPLSVKELMSDTLLYRKLLTLWSDKDFNNHSHEQVPPDLNFFNTFDYFHMISDEYTDIGLQIIKKRAVNENVAYIESMLSRVGVKGRDYISDIQRQKFNRKLRKAKTQAQVNKILDKLSYEFTKNPKFEASLNSFLSKVANDHKNIDDNNFLMRYQTYCVRVFGPVQVFADLFSGYMAAIKSPLIVGVNIVAPENNKTALADYTLHMRMFNYLKTKYPGVNRALHAGELTLGMVRPKDLLFHINQARKIADAQRIGHGVDISYETNPITLLEDLKNHSVIEINLTSNSFILGVEKNRHPYLIYSKYNVPMVICTDDSGVSRNNLTNEYLILATRYKPSYGQIKQYVYNSIKYSFLSEQDKIMVSKRIEKSFLSFEKDMAALYDRLSF